MTPASLLEAIRQELERRPDLLERRLTIIIIPDQDRILYKPEYQQRLTERGGVG